MRGATDTTIGISYILAEGGREREEYQPLYTSNGQATDRQHGRAHGGFPSQKHPSTVTTGFETQNHTHLPQSQRGKNIYEYTQICTTRHPHTKCFFYFYLCTSQAKPSQPKPIAPTTITHPSPHPHTNTSPPPPSPPAPKPPYSSPSKPPPPSLSHPPNPPPSPPPHA